MKPRFINAIYFLLLLVLILSLPACEKNEKLALATDGDADSSEIAVDGDTDMETVEKDPYLKIESLYKWHNPQNSTLSLGKDELLWSVSSAGIIGLNTSGTPDDEGDDVVLMHNELTLADWPGDAIVSSCADGSGSVWLATQNEYYLFSYGTDFDDLSDDTFIKGNLEGNFAISDIKLLLCNKDNHGVWISTGAGFLAVDQTNTPSDPADWKRRNFIGGSIMSMSPYAASYDGTQWLWLTVFVEDSLKLYAVDTKSVTDSGDSGIYPITPGFADAVQISYLAVDTNKGLWLINGTKTFYFKHGETPADTGDDYWIELLSGTELGLSAVFPANEGLAFGLKGDSDLYRLDANNTAIKKMADVGFSSDNTIKSAVSQDGIGLWYSSKSDFGYISYVDDPTDAAWEMQRYVRVGGVPANDLSGFAAKENMVYLGGSTAVSSIEYEEDADFSDFVFTSWPLSVPDDPAPFFVQSLAAIDDGILVGGAVPSYISNGGESSVWDEGSCPQNINYISANQGNFIWMGAGQIVAGVMVPWFYIYDSGGSLKKSSDDEWISYSNEYFGGLEAGPINDVDFINEDTALFGNDLGLFGVTFGEDRLDPEDLTVEVGLLDGTQSIRAITSAGNGCFWIGSLREGLSYLDTKGTAAKDDDEFYHYENVKMKSYIPSLDKNGRLYYVIDEGIMIHDPMGTPLDETDDMGVVITLNYEQRPTIAIDGRGGIWFSLQNGNGIYFARLDDGELKPWSEIWPEESTAR